MTNGQSSFIRRGVRRALAASGIVAAILYGWWQTIEDARISDLPEAKPGSPLALGRVVLTPLSLQLRSASPGEAQTQLVLSAKMENVTGETQFASFGNPFRLITVEADEITLGSPEITLLRDHQTLHQLQPRMTEDVEIAWQAPKGWQPGELSLTFFRQQFKLKDNLYGRSSWLGYSAAASMTATPEPAP